MTNNNDIINHLYCTHQLKQEMVDFYVKKNTLGLLNASIGFCIITALALLLALPWWTQKNRDEEYFLDSLFFMFLLTTIVLFVLYYWIKNNPYGFLC